MSRGCFVTGTDTGVGKTRVATALLRELGALGLATAAMKPVASGCERTAEGLRNDDALQLAAASRVALPYDMLNPYAFEAPIAPHLAARSAAIVVDMDRILTVYRTISSQADFVVVEGAGGWRVPLGAGESIATLARRLALPVVLVVGLRLGCLNHAALSAEAIRRDGLQLAGWVGNEIDPQFAEASANLETLRELLVGAPCLGVVPHDTAPEALHGGPRLDVQPLLAAPGSRPGYWT